MESSCEKIENFSVAMEMLFANKEIKELIPIVKTMQEVCSSTDTRLDVPQVVAIGAQGVGKSSVLESFVGRKLIPRGEGIVTRRPLILHLINSDEEYGEFDHCMDDSGDYIKFTDLEAIRTEIMADTDREAGAGKAISSKPITLRFFSPNVLDLTLIDLPGLTKNPTGDQPDEIEQQIEEMIYEYISKDDCLILVVSEATDCLVNVKSHKMAREIDPDGLRIIGVITKLDIMERDKDVRDIFDGKILPLPRGYIGVVNTSEKGALSDDDIAVSLQREEEFFKNHKAYKSIRRRLGTRYLQKVLSQQLTDYIREEIPYLKDKIRKQMVTLEREKFHFENRYQHNFLFKRKAMLDLVSELQSNFEREMGALSSREVEVKRFTTGARIKYIFHEDFPKEISMVKFDSDTMRRDIFRAIENLNGIDAGFFPPFKAFESLVVVQIDKLTDPIITCIDSVVAELSTGVRICTQRLQKYPEFCDYIENEIMSFIHRNSLIYEKEILALVEMEKSYMNTLHYEFLNNGSDPNETIIEKSKNKIVLEGFLDSGDGVSCDDYLCVLDSHSFTAYERDPVISFDWNGLCLRYCENDKIIIYRSSGRNVYTNTKELTITPKIPRTFPLWKKSLSDAIRNVEDTAEDKSYNTDESTDAPMIMNPRFQDVDDIYDKIDSYFRIVKNTMCDMVPKAITLFVVRRLQDYIKKDLITESILNKLDDEKNILWQMIEPNAEEQEKYEEKTKMYETCKRALDMVHI
ncbi:Dynamin [Pseudolycoriella hygida]|uniref:dynamin GTPase n=1 Tax=Pseudolycoriella hygida TaxID=35572 RepID=A0A9Q0N134_9DIPT|nr:Dynamin [Pseudolycoriella hygida]